jgi:hypothetical protein
VPRGDQIQQITYNLGFHRSRLFLAQYSPIHSATPAMNLPVLDLDYCVTKASIARPNSHADDTATPSAAENTSRQVHVRKIKALYQEPESKSVVHSNAPLHSKAWGSRHKDFYVEDSDGYILCFSEQKT